MASAYVAARKQKRQSLLSKQETKETSRDALSVLSPATLATNATTDTGTKIVTVNTLKSQSQEKKVSKFASSSYSKHKATKIGEDPSKDRQGHGSASGDTAHTGPKVNDAHSPNASISTASVSTALAAKRGQIMERVKKKQRREREIRNDQSVTGSPNKARMPSLSDEGDGEDDHDEQDEDDNNEDVENTNPNQKENRVFFFWSDSMEEDQEEQEVKLASTGHSQSDPANAQKSNTSHSSPTTVHEEKEEGEDTTSDISKDLVPPTGLIQSRVKHFTQQSSMQRNFRENYLARVEQSRKKLKEIAPAINMEQRSSSAPAALEKNLGGNDSNAKEEDEAKNVVPAKSYSGPESQGETETSDTTTEEKSKNPVAITDNEAATPPIDSAVVNPDPNPLKIETTNVLGGDEQDEEKGMTNIAKELSSTANNKKKLLYCGALVFLVGIIAGFAGVFLRDEGITTTGLAESAHHAQGLVAQIPTTAPSTSVPSSAPTGSPSNNPSPGYPTPTPSSFPSASSQPSMQPSMVPSPAPTTGSPTESPSFSPETAEFLPEYTMATIAENFMSPQEQALIWLQSHYKYDAMPSWRKQQLLALATLYFATRGEDSWNKYWSAKWLHPNVNECSWQEGSSCSSGDRYQELDLVFFGLHGTIPPELSLLTNLNRLEMQQNKLEGFLPTELGLMTRLTNLVLLGNNLSRTLPSELGKLTRVKFLGLYQNSFNGAIPSELGLMSSLEWLDLHENKLTGTIPSEVEQLTMMTSLSLGGNRLTGPIPSSLARMTELWELHLFDNLLTSTIPPELDQLTTLTQLTLDSNDLTGTIPSGLSKLTNLGSLLLHNNSLTGAVPRSICGLARLTTLRVDCDLVECQCPQCSCHH